MALSTTLGCRSITQPACRRWASPPLPSIPPFFHPFFHSFHSRMARHDHQTSRVGAWSPPGCVFLDWLNDRNAASPARSVVTPESKSTYGVYGE